MIKLLNKRYFISIFVTLSLLISSTFVLLDAFVFPKNLDISPQNASTLLNKNLSNNSITVTDNSYKDSYIDISIDIDIIF